MWWVLAAAPTARADNYDRQESWVVGASVVVGLGADRGDVGFGIDASYQYQHFWQRSRIINLEFTVWADEALAPNYGPVFHLWYRNRFWFLSGGGRAGAVWPLRVGIERGWWPGPGLTAEIAGLISNNGKVGLDLQAAIDAPWVQARVGAALGTGGWHTGRLALGVFTPLVQPQNWDDVRGDVWDPDKTVVPPGPDEPYGPGEPYTLYED